MKLEPNMYVRTKCGYICKIINIIININDFREPSMKYGVEASYLKDIMFIGDDDILKASNNIIDLIEVGDYVNKLPVEDYYTRYDEEKDDYIKIGIITLEDYWKGTFTSVEDIKSIVTKEQFSSMEYRLGDDK